MKTVSWTQMKEGTREEFKQLDTAARVHTNRALVDNLLLNLGRLRGPTLGYQIDRYHHSLQSATRALRADESVDLVVGALLHDIGDAFAPENHSEAAGVVVAPYVDERTAWIVRHHGLFQGYYYFHHFDLDRNARDIHADSPHYEACIAFCENYDQNCFDAEYDTLPIEEFVPLLREVFGRPARLAGLAPPAP